MGVYISFAVAAEKFAIAVDQIQEIYHFQKAVRVPHAPSHLLGLVNLRGRVIPVMDLRRRLGMGPSQPGSSEMIVVEVPDPEGQWLMGLLVEAILGLEDSDQEVISPLPQLPGNIGRFISGISKATGHYLVNIDRLCVQDQPPALAKV